MPDRIVRDELLESDRYRELPGPKADTARMLFGHFLLIADDLGNAEATHGIIRRKLLPRAQGEPSPTNADIDELLALLVKADLIRLYLSAGKRYAHIPKFRQRLRSYKRAHPRPPADIECKEIKEVIANLSVNSQTDDRQMSDTRRTLAAEGRKGRKEEKEGKTTNTEITSQLVDNSQPKPGGNKPPEGQPHRNGAPAGWWKSERGIEAKAADLGIKPAYLETYASLKIKCFDEIKRRGLRP